MVLTKNTKPFVLRIVAMRIFAPHHVGLAVS